MKKTFYTVEYRIWGADAPETAWFDSKFKAQMFAGNADHRNAPRAHCFSRPDSIREAMEAVADTELYMFRHKL